MINIKKKHNFPSVSLIIYQNNVLKESYYITELSYPDET